MLGNCSLQQLSQESDVSMRTLNNVCRAFTGLPVKGYIRQQRLNLALEMLRKGQSGATTVTNIATFCGFGNFGRFAGIFRDQHGELPSLVLRQPPGRGVAPTSIARGVHAESCKAAQRDGVEGRQ